MNEEQEQRRQALQDEIDSLRSQIAEKQQEIEETKAVTEVLQAQNEESKHRASEFETTLHQRWQNVEDRIHMRESNVD